MGLFVVANVADTCENVVEVSFWFDPKSSQGTCYVFSMSIAPKYTILWLNLSHVVNKELLFSSSVKRGVKENSSGR